MPFAKIAKKRRRTLRILRGYIDVEKTVVIDIEDTRSRPERAAQRRGRRTDLFVGHCPSGVLPRQTYFGRYRNKMNWYRRRHQRHH